MKHLWQNKDSWLLNWDYDEKNDKRTLSFQFEDWYHFQETLNEKQPTYDKSQLSSAKMDEGGWYGTKSWEENAEMLRNGWKKEVPEFNKFVERFENETLQGLAFSNYNYDTEGVIWDLDRYMSGEPECWLNPIPDHDKVQGAQLILNLSASAYVTADTLRKRGAAVLALARVLEVASIPTEIWCASAIQESFWGGGSKDGVPNRLLFKIPLKRAGEIFDYSRLSYGLVNPSMFRRSIFRLMEMVPDDVRSGIGIPGGYGMVEEMRESELPSGAHVIYVPAVGYRKGSGKWDSPEEGEEATWIENKLKLCGVRLSDVRR